MMYYSNSVENEDKILIVFKGPLSHEINNFFPCPEMPLDKYIFNVTSILNTRVNCTVTNMYIIMWSHSCLTNCEQINIIFFWRHFDH